MMRSLLLAVGIIGCLPCGAFSSEVCDTELDVGVILDASSSVLRENYVRMLDFFKELTDHFIIGKDKVRFGLMHYAARPYVDIRISDSKYWTADNLKEKIETIHWTQGGTRTDRALALAESEFYCPKCDVREHAQKVLVVVTDGKSRGKSMDEATQAIKAMGVRMIAIGITNHVDQDQLNQIASHPDDVININDFRSLGQKLDLILSKVCPPKSLYHMEGVLHGVWGEWSEWSNCDEKCGGGTQISERECIMPDGGGDYVCDGLSERSQVCNKEECEQACDRKLDIGVILDASSSVGFSNYEKMLKFFIHLTDQFIVSDDKVHFGGIHFSGQAYLDFRISDNKYWTPQTLKKKIATTPYPQGGTRTDRALQLAENEFFCDLCYSRKWASKVLVIVTDGKSRGASMDVATKTLKTKGVKIIAIGVTQFIDHEQLTQMASDASDIINISDFRYMEDKLNLILKKTCPK